MSTHGGKRPGAGRKPRAERFERPIAAAEKKIADRLPELIDNQFTLALGGGERTEERWEAAGTIVIEGVLLDEDGKPVTAQGRPVRTKVPAFPDKDPEELILVERKVTTLGPDRAANEYLIDRILGKPVQAVEAEVSGPQGQAIPVAFEAAIEKFYGQPDPQAEGSSESGPE